MFIWTILLFSVLNETADTDTETSAGATSAADSCDITKDCNELHHSHKEDKYALIPETDFIISDENSDLESGSQSEFHDCLSDHFSLSDLNSNSSETYSDFEHFDTSDRSSTFGTDTTDDSDTSWESEFDNSISDSSSCDNYLQSENSTETSKEISQGENHALKILSCFQKHNLTASACKDILDMIKHLIPNSDGLFDMESIYSSAGVPQMKEVHYCEVCGNTFIENPDEFKCSSRNCDGLRYKGSEAKQLSPNRQPRKSFVIADIQSQLTTLLQTPGIFEDINKCKSQINTRKTESIITDITDGSEYRNLLNSEGGFLSSNPYNLTAILNTDGINLYSSSKVELWPFFIAINELSPPLRFSRDNLLLAAIWQGKGKPPFEKMLKHLGKEFELLYNEGVKVSIQHDVITVKMAVVCGVFDLPAKASILNMTYFNGKESCITCEDPGQVVKQGKGHSRCYPYRELGQEFKARSHDEVVECMRTGTEKKRVKGFKGTSGLLAIPSYDVVKGTVPDYMHCVLLGITNTLLSKWFSPCYSGQPFFIGKHIETVSKRLLNIKPALSVERLPRNLERHFNNMKATELQMWLLFYSGPCLTGILPDNYLKHFACLSEALYILLGEHISVELIERASTLLREFYSNFGKLYGQGSCGLNVHNACIHLLSYVLKWGPVWAWSCFPFEDANAALLQSAHGTGNVTKQILKKKHIDSVVRASVTKSADGLWTVKRKADNCDICGKLQHLRIDQREEIIRVLPERLADDANHMKVVERVRVNGKQFCSKKYGKLQRRISYIVLYDDVDQSSIGSVQYFIYNVRSNLVYAVLLQYISYRDQDLPFGKHLHKVSGTNLIKVVPVDHLIDTLLYINVNSSTPPEEFVALMPSAHGHAILK